ncbi:MAPEG family protein [Pseudoruegeria sp. SK021]|uniref:MAPEG family protein n=1 Tax=Pseudoruegeria sp. SK021 TaxID=1933035 RepID=UPI000A21CC2D|nr:MAPEG family protein [Pseudoruegeria sp. SK021]OSP56113.1 hypothetical protein BV911_04020 [Pseudoruegeria sp. SK021]
MSPELTVLALAGLLQVAQFGLVSVSTNLELGSKITLGPRDGGPLIDRLSQRNARLARAMNNHFEALILLTLAVVVVTLGPGSTPFTATCAWLYLAARIAYVPAYWLGLAPWRSVIWAVGFGATVAMILSALWH